MASQSKQRLHQYLLAALGVGCIAVAAIGYPSIASAPPTCPNNTVRVQGEVVSAPETQVCDDDEMGSDGLLGNLPVVGNLPGLGGVL
jgi:hypothetical protein